ncbi:hypothetical protein SAMN05443637_112205 [Pseudonocardia thermophila]|jgi:hypothetical protein|uniref:Uncharacterized protein n=1 Tax=Pseudonocardia thermophila TaxID=1848 RepID=A0A1M6VLX4_PSETH|nr:hypothetical protein [Pseudonocardia thermophila]SHK82355.1 hypothetical protein SAMN05443637_112205 [Pseudonocardia thermophila]
MPIRTPHGRAAAYRAVWQWPLRSPARLAITAVVAVAVVAAVSFGIGALTPDRTGPLDGPTRATPTARSLPPGTSYTPAPTALPPVPALRPTELPLSAAPPAAVDAALRWTRAWVRPPEGTTAQQWLEGLRPLTTPEYLGVLSTVDPANIPATRVTGEPRAVSVAPQSVRVQVPTDALTLLVVVVDDEAGTWRVADYDEA